MMTVNGNTYINLEDVKYAMDNDPIARKKIVRIVIKALLRKKFYEV